MDEGDPRATASDARATRHRHRVRRLRAVVLLSATAVAIAAASTASSLWQVGGAVVASRPPEPTGCDVADRSTTGWSRILRGCPLAETAGTVVQVIGPAPIDPRDLVRWSDAHVEVIEATSWTGGGSSSFPAAASRCDRDADAVVFVSGAALPEQDDLAVLRAASSAFSTAAAAAPRARIVVVAPPRTADDGAIRLRRNLRVAARIADAVWIPMPAANLAGPTGAQG